MQSKDGSQKYEEVVWEDCAGEETPRSTECRDERYALYDQVHISKGFSAEVSVSGGTPL